MTHEQINKALAEKLGEALDYCNDLNAVAAAVSTLNHAEYCAFARHLESVSVAKSYFYGSPAWVRLMYEAPAFARATALLNTLNQLSK